MKSGEPASQALPLTPSKARSGAFLKGFMRTASSLPEETSARWQKRQPQKRENKAKFKTEAFQKVAAQISLNIA